MTKSPIVIYHGGCRDGFCAAWAAWRAMPAAEFHAGYYGQPPPDCADRQVYILDFSYQPGVMQAIAEESIATIWLDHHKTAIDAMRGFSHPRFRSELDLDRSGAGIAWDWFRPGEKRPWIVDYVEDRDLWRHALPRSMEVNAWLSTQEFNFKVWDGTAFGLDVEYAANHGLYVLMATENYCREVMKNARTIRNVRRLEEYAIPIVNAPQMHISELLHMMLEQHQDVPVVMGWWQRADGRFQYSLRSRKDGPDVSEIAKLYGGGGHTHAAGFELSYLLGKSAP